ncbi:Pimeloyl-ACP methyl ester carboxylesterase [Chitinophaga sp. YR573]|uniref:alpha/beta fold hydrolase n=1 Tax=Chitinophaga sp. YR573 TaxID=1881040 RepID=UPI0008AE10BE|nr:alpha/beta hydrolase [Chitinophaga sp. YR573]SEW29203.1 Pimeloyl-ACP methyl ester carboxylesterase [Chitinophaga sp. YR573]
MNSRNKNITSNDPSYLRSLPNLSDEFCAMFESIFVQTDDVKLHAVIGGSGPVVLLIGGWPQTWYQWRFIMPELAKQYTVVAVDARGFNLSDTTPSGYDSATIANDLAKFMTILGYEKFSVVGHDLGMWAGYALAADHPDRLTRLAVVDAVIPGVEDWFTMLSVKPLNDFLWHFAFNRVDDINEQLVRGREDIYFKYQFATKAASPDAIPAYAVSYYVDILKSSPERLRSSFEYYRVIDTDMAQNRQRKTKKIAIPVLAVAGEVACNSFTANDMRLLADDVSEVIIPACGHFVPEEAPDALFTALQPFLNS